MNRHVPTGLSAQELTFQNDILPLKDSLFRLALRITFDRLEAEDITQETLLRLWQQRDEWPQIENMGAYASTICRRLALDFLKRAKTRNEGAEEAEGEAHTHIAPVSPLVALPSTAPLPDEVLDQRQRLDIVRQLIDQLPEVQRTILQLRDIEGYSYDEIAQATDLTETQVKVYLHRARIRLKSTLLKPE
ncbi:MAG: RNA polymerase sigma factor [Bacteroidaceae bacterium]|nr:RNA polymerase sigma factor [Bacteroidaceae bacterium]